MKLLLTDRYCDRAKSRSAQTDYFDEKVAGLALRVAVSGRKTWTLHFTSPNDGKRARLTIGTYPATSLASARTQAIDARSKVEAGHDPRASGAADETLKAICEEYLRRATVRSKDWYASTLARLVYPKFGARNIADIKRSEIVRLLDTIEDQNGPVMADRTLAIVRKIMNWHASRSDEFRSPIVRGMARTKPKARARERTLTDEEVRAIWAAAQGPFGHLVQFLLLTATRRNEAARARRSEIAGNDWTVPGTRYKTGADHLVPLSTAAQAVLAKLPSKAFIFTTDGGKTPISGFSKFKRAFDKAAGPLPNWTLHDLRRTARSLMSRAGVPSDHAERALGHTMAGVRGTYDRHEFYEEKREAFEALAALIERIVDPQPNVVASGHKSVIGLSHDLS
jgi:integrase